MAGTGTLTSISIMTLTMLTIRQFDIFQLHYSTDLPFIHPPTFLKPLRQANALGPLYKPGTAEQSSPVQPPASTEFLLAFLALTARFHPKLIAHHSPANSNRPSNPLIASEYYASAASARMKSVSGEKLGLYDLETTQAILMLVLHDWGMNRGAQAWAYLGVAIRSAQAMGLQYEADLDSSPFSRLVPVNNEGKKSSPASGRDSFHSGSSNDAFIQTEIRRRTFWACFILDRYLSNGKYRPQSLSAKSTQIQLPASEQAFLFGEPVRTLRLGEMPADSPSLRSDVQPQRRASLIGEALNGAMKRHSSFSNGLNGQVEEEHNKWEVGVEEGLVSRYIKILDIYGKVVDWACCGGRKYAYRFLKDTKVTADVNRRDILPPWNRQSQWFALRHALGDFCTSLPRQHLLTPQNTSAHINIRTSTPYTLVHIAVSLCQILLYREFLPFIPFRHGRPQGPLDGTRPSIADPTPPPGFWEEGARECFGAARNIIDLIRACQEWGVAVETPIVCFAVYNVALLGVYVINFPWMDVNGFLRRSNPAREDHVAHGAEAARKALEMMDPMQTRLSMVKGWTKTVKLSHRYFAYLRSAWFDNAPRMMQGREREIWNDQSIATAQLHPPDAESTRVLLERLLVEMDSGEEDSDVDMTEIPQVYGMSASPSVKQESLSHSTSEQHAQQEERWNAINSVAAAASALSAATSSHGTPATAPVPGQPSNSSHFRFLSSYGASPASPSAPAPYPHHSFRAADVPSPSNAQQNSPHAAGSGSGPSWTAANGHSGNRELLQGTRTFTTSPGVNARRPSESGTPSPFAPPGATYPSMQQRRSSDKEIRDPEAWLLSLERAFGADDLAAFVDGAEMGMFAKGLARAGKGGWLGAVWGLS